VVRNRLMIATRAGPATGFTPRHCRNFTAATNPMIPDSYDNPVCEDPAMTVMTAHDRRTHPRVATLLPAGGTQQSATWSSTIPVACINA
jgi:hypothetical protein